MVSDSYGIWSPILTEVDQNIDTYWGQSKVPLYKVLISDKSPAPSHVPEVFTHLRVWLHGGLFRFITS